MPELGCLRRVISTTEGTEGYRSTEVPKYRSTEGSEGSEGYRSTEGSEGSEGTEGCFATTPHLRSGQVGGHFYLDQTSGVPPATFAGRMHSSPVAPRCSTNARGTLCSLRRLGTSTWSSLGTNSDQRLVCDHLTEVVLRSKYLDPPAAVDSPGGEFDQGCLNTGGASSSTQGSSWQSPKVVTSLTTSHQRLKLHLEGRPEVK
jgi:hypothetical protein